MKAKPRNPGASVRAQLLQRARDEQADFQLILTRFVLERLLYRLSVSRYRDRFILKGALLLAVLAGDLFRPTRDLDLLGYGDTSPDALAKIFREICSESVTDDGVIFNAEALRAEQIREESEYGGVRIRTTATIAGARIPVPVDIGYGDAVTPGPVQIQYPVLLENPAPSLRAYPLETIVAEKLEALVALGMANSRMKDYYDLFLISRTFTLEHRLLSSAAQRTFEMRARPLPEPIPMGLTDEFAIASQARWQGFLGRERLASVPSNLTLVIASLRDFLLPVLMNNQEDRTWVPGGPWVPNQKNVAISK